MYICDIFNRDSSTSLLYNLLFSRFFNRYVSLFPFVRFNYSSLFLLFSLDDCFSFPAGGPHPKTLPRRGS